MHDASKYVSQSARVALQLRDARRHREIVAKCGRVAKMTGKRRREIENAKLACLVAAYISHDSDFPNKGVWANV
jgi:hypothetical protein